LQLKKSGTQEREPRKKVKKLRKEEITPLAVREKDIEITQYQKKRGDNQEKNERGRVTSL